MATYTIEFSMADRHVMEGVPADLVPAVIAGIEKADGRVLHILLEGARI